FKRPEMHLDAPFPGVGERHMLKSGQVEVTAELPIDASQQIFIEHRRDSEGVVVGGNELGQRLFQIHAKQQRVARLEFLADLTQEVLPCLAIKVADLAAKEKHEDCLTGFAASDRPAQAIQVLGLESHDTNVGQIIELALTALESRRRDFNRTVCCGLTAGEGFEYSARFPSAAAAELNDHP